MPLFTAFIEVHLISKTAKVVLPCIIQTILLLRGTHFNDVVRHHNQISTSTPRFLTRPLTVGLAGVRVSLRELEAKTFFTTV